MEPVKGGEHAGDVIMSFCGGEDSGSSILYQPVLPSLSLIVKAELSGTIRLVIDLFMITHTSKGALKIYIHLNILSEPKPLRAAESGTRRSSW